jgi:hypothetical protein
MIFKSRPQPPPPGSPPPQAIDCTGHSGVTGGKQAGGSETQHTVGPVGHGWWWVGGHAGVKTWHTTGGVWQPANVT